MKIRKNIVQGLLTLCLCAGTTVAAAQTAPLAETLTGEAKQAYESGMLLFQDGDATGALTKFAHAHEASHDARLLWNMAVCEKEQRHYANAAAYIERYLKDAEHLTAEQRADATETLGALKAFYSPVLITNAPDGAIVSVDGLARGTTPLQQPLLLDLGAHQITVTKRGYVPVEKQLEVVGNADLEISAKLDPLPPTPAKVLPAKLTVTTTGDKDTVAIDGKVVGSRRWEGNLEPGQHALRVTAPGKKAYESHVDLAPGSTRTLHVTLEEERTTTWYWVAGGAALVAGAVGGYFLLRPEDSPGSHPTGSLATVYLP